MYYYKCQKCGLLNNTETCNACFNISLEFILNKIVKEEGITKKILDYKKDLEYKDKHKKNMKKICKQFKNIERHTSKRYMFNREPYMCIVYIQETKKYNYVLTCYDMCSKCGNYDHLLYNCEKIICKCYDDDDETDNDEYLYESDSSLGIDWSD